MLLLKGLPTSRHYPWGVGWVGSGSELSRGSGYATLSIPLWYKSYFEFKAFDYLKPSICLKAEPLSQTQWSAIPSLGTTLIFSETRSWHHTPLDFVTKLSYSYLFSLGSIYLSKKSFVFPLVPFCPPHLLLRCYVRPNSNRESRFFPL